MRRKKVASYAQPADVERAEAKLRADIAALTAARFAKALALRDTFRALVDAQTQYSGLVLDAAKLEEDVSVESLWCHHFLDNTDGRRTRTPVFSFGPPHRFELSKCATQIDGYSPGHR